jgi:hypothetical protein
MPPEPTPKKRNRPQSNTTHGIGPDGEILCGKGGANPRTTAILEEITCRSCLQSHALGEKRQPKAPKLTGKTAWIPGPLVERFDAWFAEQMGAVEGDRK